ncbi:glycosyltransferase [Enterococcus casseliflavus]|nr:glycosyltransferase [Enterococcus casseliflavus]
MLLCGCVLVKDEEILLGKCLEQLSKFTDEIIVVDNGSSDSSKEIAHKFGAKVIVCEDKFQDAARNSYIGISESEWLLVIDCDEFMTEDVGILLRNRLEVISNKTMGLIVPRYDYIGEGKWSEVGMLRLFRNKKEIKYNDRDIHASVLTSIYDAGGKIDTIYFPIHHLDGLITNRVAHKRKIMIDKIKSEINNGSNSSFLHCALGLEYAAVDNYHSALKAFEIAINKKSIIGLVFKAQYLLKNGNYDLAYKLIKDIHVDDKFIMSKIYTMLADIEYQKKNYRNVKKLLYRGMSILPESAIWYINLAFLPNIDKKEKNYLLKVAIKKNPQLLSERIYEKGARPSIFEQQTSILSYVTEMKECILDVK